MMVPSGHVFAQEKAMEHPQSVIWLPCKSRTGPLFVYLSNTEGGQAIQDVVKTGASFDKTNYLIMNTDRMQPMEVYIRINDYLNVPEGINFERIYFVFAGEATDYAKYTLMDREVFAAEGWLELSNADSFRSTVLKNEDALRTKRKWSVEVDRLREERLITSRRRVPERALAVRRNWWSLSPAGKDQPMQGGFGTWNLGYLRGLTDRIVFRADLNLGLKLPDPSSQIQEQVMDQLDFSAILSGDDLEADVNVALEGAIVAELALGGDYYLLPKKRFRPYAGMSLAISSVNLIEGAIDTTIVIEGGSLGGGLGGGGFGGGFGGGDFDRDSGDFDPLSYTGITLQPRLGFKFTLGNRISLDANLQYSYDPKPQRDTDQRLSSTQFSLGVRYHFIGRATSTIHYVKIL